MALELEDPKPVATIDGFTDMSDADLETLIDSYGPAMTLADLKLIKQQYAEVEHRNPTITEIRLFDTYWSDHCRHTTFMTELTDITIEDSRFTGSVKKLLKNTWRAALSYIQQRKRLAPSWTWQHLQSKSCVIQVV